ncbi:tyrosine-type recombinase/integrase [Falsihalocynthiibacter sp. BN13B15]|uniref:tyrosine-type recombinase/integrase n=1 Tax=Falsihalocynthiibacter sp. BN13B15 TaxID=3240871 RepID=UPI0035102DEB
MKTELTAIGLRKLAKPQKGRVELTDTKSRGLSFRHTAKGEMSWSVRLKVHGRDRRFQLGLYPEVTLSAARIACEKMRSEVVAGKDPVKDRREASTQAIGLTVADTLDLYNDLHLSGSKYQERRMRMFKRALKAHLKRPVSDLKQSDLQRMVDVVARDAPIAANRLVSELKHFTGWAFRRGYLEAHVGAALEKPTKEKPRDRILSFEEIGAIWHATEALGPMVGGFVRVLMLTGQRRGDVAGMRWEEIEGNRWEIPSTRTKNAKPHIVHLSASVLEVLADVKDAEPQGAARRKGVVFSHGAGNEIKTFHRYKATLDSLSGVADWTFHDFRTAFASHCAESGISEGIVDRVLNHVAGGSQVSAIARVYQRSELLAPRAQALDRWESIVLRASGDAEAGKVVRLAT